MSDRDHAKPPHKINGGKFEIDKKLGAGCFGEVWRGVNTTTRDNVAVKFEHHQGHALQLEHEVEILKLLAKPQQPQGFAECFYWGHEGRYECMVMELLGRSLEDRLQSCSGRFNVRSALLIAEQVIYRIEYLHSKGIIHRDIKPENFMFGVKDKIHHIYLIDFGLSKKYYDVKHVQYRTKLNLTGTARTMPSGTMKRWNGDKGFGFIQPEDGGEDVFCHVSGLLDGEGSVGEGDRVQFRITYDERKGKDRAVDVEVAGGGGGGGRRGRSRSRDRGGGYGRGGGGGGGGGDSRPGDWECPQCGANVFASKSECFKCGARKSSGGGGGRDRDYDRGGRDYDRGSRDYDRRR